MLNPIAGRISDRSTDPRGPRRPFLLRGGLRSRCSSRCSSPRPTSARPGVDALWVLVMFVPCATAYAFFQVPYVAMPAEITDSYDERTRLMTWRVAILAFTIMLSGATAPAIRDAFGGRAGYRVMGVVVAVLLVVGVVGAYVGTRHAPVGAPWPPRRALRDQLRIVAGARDFRLLLTTFVRAGAGDRRDARRRRLRVALGARRQGRGDGPVRLLRRSGPAADAGLGADRPAGRQEARLRRRVTGARARRAAAGRVAVGPHGVVFAATALVGVGYAGAQVFPMAMLPDAAAVDARRTGQNRAGVYTGVWTAGETLGLALGPGLYALVLALGGYLSSTDGVTRSSRVGGDRDRARVLGAPGGADPAEPGVACADTAGRRSSRSLRSSHLDPEEVP